MLFLCCLFFRRSGIGNNLLQYALTQQRRLRCTSTPINVEGTQKLLSFGNSNSMECAVEFCLDWLEDIDTPPTDFSCWIGINKTDVTTLDRHQIKNNSLLIDSEKRPSSTNICIAASLGHYETPQQQKFFAGNSLGYYGKDLRKNLQGRLYFQKIEHKKRLEGLDDLFTRKSNLRSNFVYASRLRYFL